ncbi:MAG: ACP S-malonyltransferase [Caldilineaceae bacterium]|nr:ACP S-malonyltransferase [Caldilineaceae bacterium]
MNEFSFLTRFSATTFLFPGQGSQHAGMISELAAAYPVARETLEEADDLLGFKLSDLCLNGPEEVLTDTINAQPALLATSVAVLRVLAQELSAPDAGQDGPGACFVAGHSMGEYTALVAAGSLSYADGLRLVRERGRLMQEAGTTAPGRMAAVLALSAEEVAAICARVSEAPDRVVQVANDNCPGQIVISGNEAGMEEAMARLSDAGARKVIPLAVSIAAHSPLMQPAAAALRAAIDATPLLPPAVPLIANTSAAMLTDVEAIRAELTAQLTGQVRWTESMQLALAEGVTRFAEIGAGDVLTGLIKRIDRKTTRLAVHDVAGVEALVAAVAA